MLKKYLLAIMLFTGINYAYARNNENPYQIARWKNFTEAAITYTFDDNCAGQYAAIDVFDEFGFRATFYPVINWAPDWTKFKQAAQSGHEIGSHTVSHQNLSELSPEEQERELKVSQKTIDSIIGPLSSLSIAYPYCIPSDQKIASRYYIAARHCQGQIEKSTPDDFYNISSIICGSEWAVNTTQHFIEKNKEANAIGGWCIYLLHGIDDDGGYSALNSQVLRESLTFLDENRVDYWLESFINVIKYIRERDQASIVEIKKTKNQIKLQLTDQLDNQIYNVPITIARVLPENWKNAIVKQNNQLLESEISFQEEGASIIFNAIPDAGTISIQRCKAKE